MTGTGIPSFDEYVASHGPVEATWASMKNSLGSLGSCSTPDQLAAIVKNRLERIQYPARADQRIPRPDRAQPRTRTTLDARPRPFRL